MESQKAVCEKCKKEVDPASLQVPEDVGEKMEPFTCKCPHCGKEAGLVHEGCGGKLERGRTRDDILAFTAYKCKKCGKAVKAIAEVHSWPK
jgi:DNA-directed RNA polymerase subunit RPC12/RpoP